RCRPRRRRPRDRAGRPGVPGWPEGPLPVRGPGRPGLPRSSAGRRPGAARARRADRGAGPGAPPRPVAAVPGPGPSRRDGRGVEPRDGRGHPVRPARAAEGRSGPRRRHARRTARPHRGGGRRGRVPRARRGEGGGRVTPRLTLATAQRVLRQVLADHRSVAMILVVPLVLIGLLAWILPGELLFDRIGPALLGIFPMVVMFLVTSITMLRERTSGTL